MKWVTRIKPHVDRCSSLWLIKNFVDSEAEFAFVPRDYVWKENEIPLVLPGAELTPQKGKTTFELIIQKYKIKDKITAKIIPRIVCLSKISLFRENGFFKITPNFKSFFFPNLQSKIMIAIACPNKSAKIKFAVVKGSKSNMGIKITTPIIPKHKE